MCDKDEISFQFNLCAPHICLHMYMRIYFTAALRSWKAPSIYAVVRVHVFCNVNMIERDNK